MCGSVIFSNLDFSHKFWCLRLHLILPFSSSTASLLSNNWYQSQFVIVEGKIRIKKFNNANFRFRKMQIENYLYQKDFYLHLSGKVQKPKEMYDSEWDILDQKVLGTIRLSLASAVVFNVSREKAA